MPIWHVSVEPKRTTGSRSACARSRPRATRRDALTSRAHVGLRLSALPRGSELTWWGQHGHMEGRRQVTRAMVGPTSRAHEQDGAAEGGLDGGVGGGQAVARGERVEEVEVTRDQRRRGTSVGVPVDGARISASVGVPVSPVPVSVSVSQYCVE